MYQESLTRSPFVSATGNPRSFPAALARAWRSLRRRPGLLVIAVSSLAIALGLATTVIAQIDSLLHPYVAMHEPERLYTMLAFGVGANNKVLTAEGVAPLLRASPVIESVVPA